MGHRRTAPALVVAALAALAAPALAGDIIINSQGKPLGNPKASVPPTKDDYNGSQWEIVDETLDGVSYRIPDVPQPQLLPMSSIKAVYHDPSATPSDLAKGKLLADQGNTEAAREAFAKVAKDAEAAPWARSEAAFRAATTFGDEGNAGEAEKAFAAFKSAFPKSKWVTTATELRARALLSMEKIDDAKSEFASLKKLPGVSEDVGIEADFWLIWIDEQVATRRNDKAGLTTAMKGYEALAARLQGKSQFENLVRRCHVGKASCMILLDKAAEARDELDKQSKETKDPRTLAGIYNKLGMATWRAGGTDKASMHLALKHFLRVVTLYGDAQGADEDCAEAMFHAGELFRELKDQGPDWGSRARREWSDVIARFPASGWAQKSKEAMAGR